MKKVLKWLRISFVALVVISMVACGGSDPSTNTTQNEQVSSAAEKPASTPAESEQTVEPVKEEKKEPEDKITKFKSSSYKVGTDMPAGEYKLFSDDIMSYFEISKDSSGSFDSIVANDNFFNFSYISVKDGQYVKLQGCYAVPIAEAPVYSQDETKYIPGKYKVGFDIPAGEYKVIADGAMAYIEVSKNSSATLDAVISNDVFEGNKYITVSDGQYIKLQDAYIEK